MKTRPLLSAVAGLALAFLLALLGRAAAANAPAAPPASHPLFLWKVTGGNGTVFLLGSIHAAKADFYPLPQPIEADFDKSSVLVEEINLTRQDPAQLRRMVLEQGLYPPGDRLDNHISAATRRALQKYLRQSGQSLDTFAHLKPWLVAVLVGGSTVAADGISSRYGIDEHFAREAKALHKPTAALESVQYQLNLLSDLPAPLQDAMLLSSLRDATREGREVEALLDAWQRGDAKPIEAMIARDERRYPQLKPVYEALLPDRNRRMAAKIATYLDIPKTWFVVVGVGHLIGRDGIVALLRDRNYRVARISSQ
jgi:uncharacterized protein YbaP (TraB family)